MLRPIQLMVSEEAATYLMYAAEDGSPGYKWPSDLCYYESDLAAEAGRFLLELYIWTEDPKYLCYAEGVADYIMSQAIEENGDYW